MASSETFTQPEPEPEPHINDEEQTINGIVKVLNDLLGKAKTNNTSTIRVQHQDTNAVSLPHSISMGGQIGKTSNKESRPGSLRKTQSETLPDVLKQEERLEDLVRKLLSHVGQLKRDGIKLKDLQADVKKALEKHLKDLSEVEKEFNSTRRYYTKEDLKVISRKIFNLMCQVPLLPDKREKGASDSQNDDEYHGGRVDVYLPGIHKNEEDLTQTEAYEQVIKNFKSLTSFESKMCLLSFAVFPENGVVNKTMLMYWWIAEDLLPVEEAEEKVKIILKDFVEKELIEPIEDRHKTEPASYKMPPLVHSAVVRLSMAVGLFDIYDEQGKPTMKKSEKKKVCLVEGSSSKDEAKLTKMNPKDIETIFNVSERFPDFTFKWFKVMQMLKVLYLGRWERTAKRHIEVESPELMKNLNSLGELRMLSLQGISRIERLDDSVCKLRKLIILDLRACYNLEKLPEKIDSLENLIYLDISECYMLDRMPKRLAWLENLKVLKGFVVSDADEETTCRLIDLKHLKNLTKLSVTINKKEFDMDKLGEALVELKALKNLKVAWGGTIEDRKKKKKKSGTDANSTVEKVKAFFGGRQHARRHVNVQDRPGYQLHKLDLQCFPDAQLPDWLLPQNLITLKKLYIKGGTELTGLGDLPEKPTKCGVKVLRLKFLPKLQVEWRDLKELYFPKMEFLEKYQCPRVTLCPCDGKGIWNWKP